METRTFYEIVFTGTRGRQRKARRRTFSIDADSVTSQITGEDLNSGLLGAVVTNVLKGEGAKAGKWSLETYKAECGSMPSSNGESYYGVYEIAGSRAVLATGSI